VTRQALIVTRLVGEGKTMSGWNIPPEFPQEEVLDEIVNNIRQIAMTGTIETLSILIGEGVMDDHMRPEMEMR
jgi:hypothetical protein